MPGRGRPVHPPLAPGRRRGRHPPPLRGSALCHRWDGGVGQEANPTMLAPGLGPRSPRPPAPHGPSSPHSQRLAPSPLRPPASSPHGAVRCGRGSAAILGRSRAEPSQARAPQHPNRSTPHLLLWVQQPATLPRHWVLQPPPWVLTPRPRQQHRDPAPPPRHLHHHPSSAAPARAGPSLSPGTSTSQPAPVPAHAGP